MKRGICRTLMRARKHRGEQRDESGRRNSLTPKRERERARAFRSYAPLSSSLLLLLPPSPWSVLLPALRSLKESLSLPHCAHWVVREFHRLLPCCRGRRCAAPWEVRFVLHTLSLAHTTHAQIIAPHISSVYVCYIASSFACALSRYLSCCRAALPKA